MTRNYDIQKIRMLLTEGFTENELRNFCLDQPQFRILNHNFPQRDGYKLEIIRQILDHASRKNLLDILLSWAEAENPTRYTMHEPYIIGNPPPPPPIDDSPISEKPPKRYLSKIISIIFTGIAILLLILAYNSLSPNPQDYEVNFKATTDPIVRLENLAELFTLNDSADRAQALFFNLTGHLSTHSRPVVITY